MTDGTIVDLATLIHYVAEVPGVERIRFTTSHPVEFSDSLIEAYANVPSSPITCILQCNQARTASSRR
jgi:tRNA-2-methylthio-N6-dimethylallyladenosine synthase